MKTKGVGIWVLTIFLICLFPAGSWAKIRSGAFTISPMLGGYSFDNDRDLEDLGRTATLGFGYNITQHIGTELSFSFIHTDSDLCCNDGDVYAYQPRLDLLYYLTPDKAFVPYLALGLSSIFFDDDEISNPDQNPPYEVDDTVQGNAGLGVKYFVSDDVALRADARYYYGFEDSESEYLLSAGMEFQLGAKQAPEPCRDIDRDGICDDIDNCIDVDKDGVCDDKDQCPDTPSGIRVDENGCQIKIEPHIGMEKTNEPPQIIEESDKEEKVIPEMMRVVVYFDSDKAVVKSLYHKSLRKLADFMMEYPQIIATIEGHTDSRASDAYNLKLSEKRAENVKKFLVEQQGLDTSRFIIKRFGETLPEAPNKTAQGRAKNRRVVTVTIME